MLIERLIRWSHGETAQPLKVHLQITRACNLRCQSCWQPADTYRSHEKLGRERLLAIVAQAAALGVKEWNIIGGEPLARRETTRLTMDKIRALGMNGDLSTNGTLFTEELIASMVDSGWAHVRFSIDCADAATHDRLRGHSGAFSAAEWAMKSFHEVKQRHRSAAPRIEIMMVLSSRNYRSLPKMIDFAASLGVEKLTVQPASILSSEGEELRLDVRREPEILEWIHRAKQTADRAGLEHQIGDLYEERLLADTDQMNEILLADTAELPADFFAQFCFDPWFMMAIRPNGDIGPCDRFVDKFKDDGPRECDNVLEQDLSEIWTGAYFTKIRGMVASGIVPHYCKDCCVCKITHCRSLRAMAYRRMGRHQDAIAIYSKALQDNPHQDNYWLGIGSCFQELRQFERAIEQHRKVVAINPGQAWGWYGLGDSCLQLERFEEASGYFRTGLAQAYLEPHLKFLLSRGLGVCSLKLGDCISAVSALETALALENHHADLRRMIEQCTQA